MVKIRTLVFISLFWWTEKVFPPYIWGKDASKAYWQMYSRRFLKV